MTRLDIVKAQIAAVKAQTLGLITDIDKDEWLLSPEVLNTNVNWQIGHLFMANYLHGVASVSGVNPTIREKADIASFKKFYVASNPLDFTEEKPSADQLLELYELIFDLTEQGLATLTEASLDEATAIPNPEAKTKYEALMHLAEHQIWHNGQIAMLKRVMKERKEVVEG